MQPFLTSHRGREQLLGRQTETDFLHDEQPERVFHREDFEEEGTQCTF